MSKYGIQSSYLGSAINVGRLNKAQDSFLEKEDHTDAAIHAVVEHVFRKYGGSFEGFVGDYGFEIKVTLGSGEPVG